MFAEKLFALDEVRKSGPSSTEIQLTIPQVHGEGRELYAKSSA